MIESIYSSQAHGSTSSALVKIPKNVRQIGQVNDLKKIYVEDYVMSFIKKLGIRKESSSELVVLLGQFVKINNCQCIFINGAIELKDVIYEDNLVFSNEVWTNIYETIKQYFTNVEIVGWSIIRAGLPLNVDERIKKVHVDNFAGQDKTLLLYDSLEREEAFYVFEENKLKRQDGYYIFYDKNAEMQNYIIRLREEHGNGNVKPYSIPRRPQVSEKLEEKQAVRLSKRKPALVYGLGAVAAVVVLVFSAATLNSYDTKINQKQESTDVLSDNVKENNKDSKGAKEVAVTGQDSLPIETAKGKLSTINNDEQNIANKGESKKSSANETKKQSKDSDKVAANENKKNSKKKTEKKASTETSAKNNYYVVKKGDSLSSISMKLYNTRSYVKKIKKLNNIEDSDMIKVGQKLLLP
nr:LysM peptidoglycan-binding domain-containing protein [uncultured Lachnoclostridium sp.]